ncbi:outer membrane beta-barrel protein [Pedobacter sp. UBA5917]|uniref:outer membrane beta-barrel protein n=1 Tax=Pedobacter sp. UBA5917 TaxID=1947061 RepID=UPI0025E6668E|nr:outer membrane beta-barrel protein [Pedobacter sp. UBA5917]
MTFSKYILLLGLCFYSILGLCQDKNIKVAVLNQKGQAIAGATVQLLKASDERLVKTAMGNENGIAVFTKPKAGKYIFVASALGYTPYKTAVLLFPFVNSTITINLSEADKNLGSINVVGKKQFIEHVQGKTIVNVDAAVTNTGTTILEVLEKSPGVIVDKNGSISLQGKSNVLVMIDDKLTYLSGSELSNLLGNMSSSQVNQIELITNPSAKYDASGNAGIINIKTKKTKQEGFNGSLITAYGQGKYYKNNNSLTLNYRKGAINVFANYGVNLNQNFSDIYAYRQYFGANSAVISALDQTSYFVSKNSGHLLKTGLDYYVSEKTTIGLTLTGALARRNGGSDAIANWENASGKIDSAIATYNTTDFRLKNGAANLNLKQILSKNQNLSIDLDILKYVINNDQRFTNQLLADGGYTRGSLAQTPSNLRILSAKADYIVRFGKNHKLESGFKSSSIKTDNIAAYQLFEGNNLSEDLNKSNHFLYQEDINALYSSFESKFGKFNAQAGLRYENTHYNAHQLGNSIRRDSAFSRNYSNLFPSGYISYSADSANTFSLTAGRRIDRPPYQKLNPFIYIINKYTYQRGNPFFLPQYSWNFELTHQFKRLLTTTVSFSTIKDYFSQLFISEGNDILVYTDGNVGKMNNLGLSASLQLSPFSWWQANIQGTFNHKQLKGYQNIDYSSSINQLQVNLNNQFTINKGLSAEISGYYITRARNDLQELLYPTGQLSVGLSQNLFKGKGSLKLNARDIFFTQAMEGLTGFPAANEYFILKRDTRVVSLAFTYRFGKPLKTTKRSTGGAAEEINRAGN